jgi:tetratricopeptide (TPR) repeat protein
LAVEVPNGQGHRGALAQAALPDGGVELRQPDALAALEEAPSTYHEIGDRRGEANALNELAAVRIASRDYAAASTALNDAVVIFETLGDSLGLAQVANRTGRMYLDAGDPQQALAHYRHALIQSRTVSSSLEEAHALEGIGTALGTAGAQDYRRQALKSTNG